jgi:anti-sigma factor RsiW
LAAGAAAILVLWTGLTLRSPRISLTSDSGSGLVEQLVSSHLRSLIANHLMDVVSTGQHTVKPWFAGKLSLSPPVYDFTDQGFKPIGGRLDYLRKTRLQRLFTSIGNTTSIYSSGPARLAKPATS